MVRKLEIQNYAIIESLTIEFSEHLNIITGETGSGKSILLGALGLIIGKRADSKALLNQGKKCVVEGTFDIGAYGLESFFKDADLDYEKVVLIRREINTEGKSRAFINDTPVNLKTLQNLTTQLVDLHQQFENLGINEEKQQVLMLDAYAKALEKRASYEKIFKGYRNLKSQLKSLQERQSQAVKQRDYLQFQLDELLTLQIDPNKDLEIEQKLSELEHAGEIASVLGEFSYSLEESESSLLGMLKELKGQLHSVERFHPSVPGILERLNQSQIELEDLSYEAKKIAEQSELDPETAGELRSRVDRLNTAMHKHQVPDITQLMQIQEDIEEELGTYLSLDEEITDKEREIKVAEKSLKTLAGELTSLRRDAVGSFDKKVNALLAELKMEHASFMVEMKESEVLLPHGADEIHFMFAPNKGSDFFEIKKVASGGEMSRLALITKSLVAGSLHMPTLVFDEIDSGVSGDVAKKMGEILKRLSKTHQVISITHSPQVAAKADLHFTVYKETTKADTKTRVRKLDEEGRLVEIATMLSSSPPSKAALASAKELMLK